MFYNDFGKKKLNFPPYFDFGFHVLGSNYISVLVNKPRIYDDQSPHRVKNQYIYRENVKKAFIFLNNRIKCKLTHFNFNFTFKVFILF